MVACDHVTDQVPLKPSGNLAPSLREFLGVPSSPLSSDATSRPSMKGRRPQRKRCKRHRTPTPRDSQTSPLAACVALNGTCVLALNLFSLKADPSPKAFASWPGPCPYSVQPAGGHPHSRPSPGPLLLGQPCSFGAGGMGCPVAQPALVTAPGGRQRAEETVPRRPALSALSLNLKFFEPKAEFSSRAEVCLCDTEVYSA